MIDRRKFVGALAGCLLRASLAAEAQETPKTYRIGVLSDGLTRPGEGFGDVFRQSLGDLGYVEGRNLVIEWRNPGGRAERLDVLAAELVRLRVDVIVATYPAAVFSAKRATTTIPIVMVHTPDPVQLGLVASLAHPGGNVTGTSSFSLDLSIKQLQILREALPRTSRIAVVWNPDNPWHPISVQRSKDRAQSLGVQLQSLRLKGPEGIPEVFAAMTKARAQAVLFLADPVTFINRRRLVDLAIKQRLSTMGGPRDYAEAGFLMSYWAATTDLYRRAAGFVDRIFKGARVGELPIEQSTKFELVINLKTAKALGLTVPPSLLQRADQVIE